MYVNRSKISVRKEVRKPMRLLDRIIDTFFLTDTAEEITGGQRCEPFPESPHGILEKIRWVYRGFPEIRQTPRHQP